MSDDERHEHNFEQVSRYSLGCCLCTIVLFSVWPFFPFGTMAPGICRDNRETGQKDNKPARDENMHMWMVKKACRSQPVAVLANQMGNAAIAIGPPSFSASCLFLLCQDTRISLCSLIRLFWLACFPIFLLPQRTISPTFYFATLPSLPTPRSRRSPLVLFLSFFTSPPTSPISLNFPFPPSSKLSPLD